MGCSGSPRTSLPVFEKMSCISRCFPLRTNAHVQTQQQRVNPRGHFTVRSSRVAVPTFSECPTQHPSFSSQCLRCGLPAPRALPQRSSTPASHKRSSAPLGGILRPIRRCRCPLSAASSGVTEGLWVTLAFLGTCASVHALKLGFLHWISPRFSTLLLARHDLGELAEPEEPWCCLESPSFAVCQSLERDKTGPPSLVAFNLFVSSHLQLFFCFPPPPYFDLPTSSSRVIASTKKDPKGQKSHPF